MEDQQINEIKAIIEGSFDKLQTVNFNIENYLGYLTNKYAAADEKTQDNDADPKISLLVDTKNKAMCPKGHLMGTNVSGNCNKCSAKSAYDCWSCSNYDYTYDKDNWDGTRKLYKWCEQCSLKNGNNVKKRMAKIQKMQAEIIDFYNKYPEISVDLLCGLPTKLSLEFLLKEIVVDADKEDYCLYSFDIDNFKKLNKQLGHNGADKKLKQIGNILKQYSDKSTKYWTDQGIQIKRVWSFRPGGDEFALIIKGKYGKIKTQKEFVLKLKQEINAIGIGVSIGVLCYCAIKNTDEWLNLCDLALYKAKSIKGKNGLRIYDGGYKKVVKGFDKIKFN
eukprot:88242_1